MAKVLVTGSNGQVGNELQFLASKYSDLEFVFVDIEDLDITNTSAVNDFFEKHSFNYTINCAAYTAVDKAESNEAIAFAVNVTGSENLAKAAASNQGRVIQLSTDYVYHNQQNRPFKEDDTTNPQSVYADTKLKGDFVVLENDPQGIVVRTSWVYSSFGHNFVKTMIRLGNERDQLGVVFDQIGTPTYARDLAKALLDIIVKLEAGLETNGVFHYSNEGVGSWYDFAQAIFEMENIDVNLSAIESSAYPTPAKRPPFSVLNKSKIKQTFGLEIPHWRTALSKCLQTIKEEV